MARQSGLNDYLNCAFASKQEVKEAAANKAAFFLWSYGCLVCAAFFSQSRTNIDSF